MAKKKKNKKDSDDSSDSKGTKKKSKNKAPKKKFYFPSEQKTVEAEDRESAQDKL